jgi:hypothetical protein
MTEKWKPVVGHEGQYEVSDHGRVRSVGRIVCGKRGSQRFVQGLVLSHGVDQGYHKVALAGASRKVHRLVLEAFIGPAGLGEVGCHNNGNPSDNRLSNLRWDSRSANNRDRVLHGTDHNAAKIACPQGHPYEGENLIAREGKRICRHCSRAASRRYTRNNKPDLARRTHGLVGTYSAGCRCEPCRVAGSEWNRARYRAKDGAL